MSEAQSRFLDRASQNFGDDLEKRYSSQTLLEDQLSNDESLMDMASEKMEEADRRPKSSEWLVPVALIIIGSVVVLVTAFNLYRMAGILGRDSLLGIPIPSREHEPWSYYFDDLNENERLLLFGDTDLPDEASRRKAFWKSEPDNVGAYIEYLSSYRMENEAFPEDMLEIAKKLDPDNAIFYLFRAGEVAEECTKRVNPSRGSSKRSRRGRSRAGAAPTPASVPAVIRKHVAITDAEMHREAMLLVHKAASMPKCSSYGKEMMLRRLPLLQRDDHDWMSRVLPVVYLASQLTHSMPLMKVASVVRAEAYRCEQEKDGEALKLLIVDWMSISRHVHSSSQYLIDGLVLRAFIQAPCEDFSAAAKACGLVEMEQYFTGLGKKMADEKDARYKHSKLDDDEDGMRKDAGFLSTMSLPILHRQVNDASKIPEPDLRPDRLADHAFWNRICSAIQWKLMLLFSLIAVLWRYRSNGLLRKLGQRLACVFSWRDWAYVVLWCGIAPVGLYWFVNGADTAMSVQRYNLLYSSMMLPAGQSGSLLLLLVLAPMLAISCRLKKVLPLQIAPPPRMIWVAVILVVVSMPLFGLAGVGDYGLEKKLMFAYSFQGMAILFLLATPFISMVRKSREVQYTIGKAIRGQLIIRVYLLTSLVMALQIPVYHAVEKHWVAEDEVFKLNPEYTSFTMTETHVTKQLLKELDALLTEVSQDIENVHSSE